MSKVPGGQKPSEHYLKEEAQRQGLGTHTEQVKPKEAPVAGDAPDSNIGITEIRSSASEAQKHAGPGKDFKDQDV